MLTLKLDPGQLRQIQAKTTRGRVTREPVHDLLEAAGRIGVDRVKRYAPRRTGNLGGSFQKQLVERGDTAAVKVFSNFTRGNFRLAYAMDKSGRFHYRSSGPRGRSTKGYLSKRTLKDVRTGMRRLANDASRAIESLWSRRVA